MMSPVLKDYIEPGQAASAEAHGALPTSLLAPSSPSVWTCGGGGAATDAAHAADSSDGNDDADGHAAVLA